MTSKRIYGPYKREASSLCFGTMQFGAGATEADSAQMYEDCRAAGINFFDTAYVYTEGQSEKILGRLIATEREQIILVTKAGAVGGSSKKTYALSLKLVCCVWNRTIRTSFFCTGLMITHLWKRPLRLWLS